MTDYKEVKTNNNLITAKEASERLGLDVQTVRRYCREGDIKSVLFGRYIRIEPLELENFIEKHRRKIK